MNQMTAVRHRYVLSQQRHSNDKFMRWNIKKLETIIKTVPHVHGHPIARSSNRDPKFHTDGRRFELCVEAWQRASLNLRSDFKVDMCQILVQFTIHTNVN